jgi:hypothetical protein
MESILPKVWALQNYTNIEHCVMVKLRWETLNLWYEVGRSCLALFPKCFLVFCLTVVWVDNKCMANSFVRYSASFYLRPGRQWTALSQSSLFREYAIPKTNDSKSHTEIIFCKYTCTTLPYVHTCYRFRKQFSKSLAYFKKLFFLVKLSKATTQHPGRIRSRDP